MNYLQSRCVAAVKTAFDAEIDAAQARLAHLTGICPKCGDDGWWIDDAGYQYCDCKAFESRADKQGAFVREGTPGDVGEKAGCSARYSTEPAQAGADSLILSRSTTLLIAERNYDAAKADWQRELYLTYGEPGLSLRYWQIKLAKGAKGSLLREKYTAFIAARKAYDDAGEEVADDMPDDERCGECDGLRGSCGWCQGECVGDARRGDD